MSKSSFGREFRIDKRGSCGSTYCKHTAGLQILPFNFIIKMYRESLSYANFITANFITVIFQDFPEIFGYCDFWDNFLLLRFNQRWI